MLVIKDQNNCIKTPVFLFGSSLWYKATGILKGPGKEQSLLYGKQKLLVNSYGFN